VKPEAGTVPSAGLTPLLPAGKKARQERVSTYTEQKKIRPRPDFPKSCLVSRKHLLKSAKQF
ncbi:MAG: hypothetical protein IJT43_03635, partial [Stomatobaculum sp.]|nr:hypothetical protein [Stomatobaculum sp.]